jgi:hypothetical protein
VTLANEMKQIVLLVYTTRKKEEKQSLEAQKLGTKPGIFYSHRGTHSFGLNHGEDSGFTYKNLYI